MWLGLLLNNAKSIGYIAAILAVFGSGMWVEAQFAKTTLKEALLAQETALVAKCKADKEITRKSGEDYEAKITDLNKRVSAAKRLYATKCVPIAHAPIGADGSPTAGLPRADGIDAQELLTFAGDAEKQREQLISLQNFVRLVWAQ